MSQALVEKIIEEQRKPPAFQDMVHLVTVLDAQVWRDVTLRFDAWSAVRFNCKYVLNFPVE